MNIDKILVLVEHFRSDDTHSDASMKVMAEVEETKSLEQNRIDINMKRHLMPRPTNENHLDTGAVECRM